jgi:aminopeptidase N
VLVSLFNTTPKISTYLYAVCAGKYGYYEQNSDDGLQMRIYLRESLKAEFNPDEMFLVTKAGMKTYKEYFGKAYPFSKYD